MSRWKGVGMLCARHFSTLVGKISCDWYNGHYSKDKSGEYSVELFPIPVISIAGLCDIELNFDRATVSTKLPKDEALGFPYELFGGCKFEAYGVEDYLSDYYLTGMSMDELRENIRKSGEKEIGFSFWVCESDIPAFIEKLRSHGFYY